MNTETYNSSLPLLAAALSDQRGIRVDIGGNHAFTDGKTIHVPSLPLDADETLLGVARGFIDHESAHVLFTDFSASSDNQLSQLEKFFANAIEDVRVEKLMADRFPGCAQHFRQTAKQVFVDRAEPYEPAFAVPNYVLLRLRRETCPELASRAAQATLDVTKHFPDLLPKLALIFGEMARSCPDTRASIAYGKRFAALLQDYEEERLRQEIPGDVSFDTYAVSLLNDGSESGQDEEADAKGDPTKATSLAPLFADDVADHLPHGIGEALSSELENSRHNDPYDGFTTAIEVPAAFRPMSPSMLDKTVRLQAALRPLLRGVLQADTFQGRMPAMYGKLNPRKLYSVPLGNGHVFTRHIPARLMSTALHLLIDRSGSTTSYAHEIAVSAYAVAHAAAGIRGVNVGMTVFPVSNTGEHGTNQPCVATLIRHGQMVPSHLDFGSEGLTPLAEATWHVLPILMKQREPRKILLVFTDGQPDSEDKAKAALHDADALGIETYGVSFRSTSITDLIGAGRSTVISDIAELPKALSDMLVSVLRKAA